MVIFVCGTLVASAQATNTADAAQITTCSQNGQQPVAVGTRVASGTYVPVADQAVITNTSDIIKNTGILVYKECILREIVNAQRKAATAGQIRNAVVTFMSGRDGNPLFSQDINHEVLVDESDPALLRTLQDGTLDTLNPAFKNAVIRAVGQGYYNATRRPQNAFTCPYQGNLTAVLNGNIQGSVPDALWAMGRMSCNPIFAVEMAHQKAFERIAVESENLKTRLSWGQGIYQRQTIDENGNIITQTPGSIVKTMIEQQLTSGFRQQESANNVAEMVGTLFSNISTQILSNNQGLSSLTNGTTGSGSFLDQVVAQAGGQVVQSTTNAALQTLNNVLAIEITYNRVVSAIATDLTQTIGRLRGVENQCWASVTQNVCATGTLSADGKTCTSTSTTGVSLTIATSTQFSQAVIDAQIMALASSTFADLTKSNNAITALNSIIRDVANTASTTGQTAAIIRYNALVQQGAFHSQSDVTNIQIQQQSIFAATTNLIQNTINTWAGTDTNGNSTIAWDNTINPGTGWCNYQSQSTLDQWIAKWR